ncbi:MAG: oxidoreductase [Lautropia sp. SCN 70-15]|nr:MAG: oxidoreductase [Lautropia sp. SCN 70-15]
MIDPYESRDYDARDLSGRVAIVSGGGSRTSGIGNGRAAAVLLARRGARVLVIDLERHAAHETVAIIEKEGGVAVAFGADVTQVGDCRSAVALAVDRWNRVDVLVNNVGIGGPPGTAVDVDIEAWDHAMRVNVTSMVLMSRFAVPEMARNNKGAIVNISSVAGLTGGHASLLYPTSKGAIVNMTRAMAAQHAAQGIRVNCVAPGMVFTPMVSSRGMTPELREARRQRSLLQTEGTGWDVGEAVAYLASDAARWITGVVLPVDAGTTAGTGRLPIPPSDGRRN